MLPFSKGKLRKDLVPWHSYFHFISMASPVGVIMLHRSNIFTRSFYRDIDALEETTEKMKEEVSQLEEENEKLEASVKQLESSVRNLKASKEKLDILTSVQGQSTDELERQLAESRNILEMQKDNLSGDILSNIMTVVLAADDDGDMLLSDAEINEVTKNIESLQGVDFNDAQLKKLIIGKGRDISGQSKYQGLNQYRNAVTTLLTLFRPRIAGLMDMVKTLLESETVEIALKKFREEFLQSERSLKIDGSI
jgi:exonuclease VII small subunit